MWARVHKIDRLRPLANGGAVIVIEDERSATVMQRVPSLSKLVAIARVLSARRMLDAKYGGAGEVRYAAGPNMPSFLSDVITAAGASVAERDTDRVIVPAQPAGVAALIDVAFSELAHHSRGSVGLVDLPAALKRVEADRRAKPIDREQQPERYWTAVLELAALAGELARKRGGRWIETHDVPLPFALKFPDGALAKPTATAEKIVAGGADDTLATEPA